MTSTLDRRQLLAGMAGLAVTSMVKASPAMAAAIQWQGPTDGVSDCTPYLNSVIASLPVVTEIRPTSMEPVAHRILEIPSGRFCFKSTPKPLGKLILKGDHKLNTALCKQFVGPAFLTLDGTHGHGAMLSDLGFWCSAAFTHPAIACGDAIFLHATASGYAPDETIIQRCWFSSDDGGLWYNAINVNGLARTGNGVTVPQGIREVVVEDCEIFNTFAASVVVTNGVGFQMRGGACVPGKYGPLAGCGIVVGGGGGTRTNSTCVTFSGVNNNGFLNLANSSIGSFTGGQIGSLSLDPNSTQHWKIDTACAAGSSESVGTNQINLY